MQLKITTRPPRGGYTPVHDPPYSPIEGGRFVQTILPIFPHVDMPMGKQCLFSEDMVYRLWLRREWDTTKMSILWVMFNPSTADDETDDPTIGRCIDFSQRWGYGGMYVVNLFAFRSTDPKGVWREPIHRDENQVIAELSERMKDDVIVAWGGNGNRCVPRVRDVCAILSSTTNTLSCLTVTEKGHPRHPLYCSSRLPRTQWTGEILANGRMITKVYPSLTRSVG